VLVGTPTEMKAAERRVGLTPDSARELVTHGHEVVVQRGAGDGIGAPDSAYEAVGARLVDTAEEVFAEAELIVKVKEPQAGERALLRDHHLLFAYLHLAPDPAQADDLVASGATCLAYETVTDRHGHLPLLAPMSKVAGRMSVQAGAHCLESPSGGAGILIGGVPGVPAARVVVLGGGVVGENAVQMALGLAASVTVVDRDVTVLDRLSARFGPQLSTVYSTRAAVEDLVLGADLVIGAVLVRGARAPHLVTAEMVKHMRPGSVLVDVAIDQGGCFETSHPTTHDEPTFVVDDVVHYCVANMPGAVARTSAHALNNVTLPHVLALADRGLHGALAADPHLRDGLNVHAGQITEAAVADALGREHVPAEVALGLGS
jgi:alanine dehydrogenase